ncbi:hypothetical protein LPC08_14605 [Roseomonas sp. OT10]|uniref:hypothetical protein n=1 Tax=Roseomonas cutis TaxID=2897332 RepID=UPI001E2D6014|nr:hypothetical protein [Roseomonas sp. OT10]UFN47257.1 hypothetical protein LPC08_14605 [Roseomonas sp. OT10]
MPPDADTAARTAARPASPPPDRAAALPCLAVAPPPRPPGRPAAEAWNGEAERRRVALALMQEAARGQGGQVTEEPLSGALLLRAPQPVLDRTATVLAPLFSGRVSLLAPRAALSRPPPPRPAEPVLLERRPILGLASGAAPRLAGLRLVLPREWPGMNATAPAHLRRHAADRLLQRAAEALAAPGGAERLLGEVPDTPLHLDRPLAPLPPPPGLASLPVLPVLPLARLAEGMPAGPFGVAGMREALLELCEPSAVPGAVVHLAFDPDLARQPGLVAALEPGRLVLEGVAEEWVLSWGLSLGIGRFTGPWAERLLEEAA